MTYSKKIMLTGAAVTALMLGMTGVSFAGQDVNARIDSLENELRQLKATVQARDAKLEALEAKTADLDTLPKFDGKKLKVTSADGQYSMELFGRVQIDASIADSGDLAAGHDLDGGIELRRVRTGVAGKLAGDWEYKVEIGFEAQNDSISVEEAFVSYVGIDDISMTVGKLKMPFSLEEKTSSRFITFMERGLPNLFAPGKQLGGEVAYEGERFGAAIAYMVENDLMDGSDSVSAEDNGVVGRVNFAPVYDKDNGQAVHLGLSALYLSDQDGTERFRQRPEIHNADRLIDTGAIANVDDVLSINPEAAVAFGSFSAQAEYNFTQVGRTAGSDIDLNGGYFFVSYFLTGESRAAWYKPGAGKFDRPKVTDAVEIAARVSYLDLEDAGIVAADRGKETDYTFGLNYYFNPNVRAKFNYIYADVDHPAGATVDESANIFGARIEADF